MTRLGWCLDGVFDHDRCRARIESQYTGKTWVCDCKCHGGETA